MSEEENQQELLFKFSMFERQIKEIQQQIEAVERGIIDLTSLNIGLDELKNGKDKEIFAAVGKGIFVKAKIISDELNVDIGNGNFVKKSVEDTKKLIDEQIKKLETVKKELNNNFEILRREINSMMNSAEHNHCNCGHEHSHEECSCSHEECNCGCED